MFCLKTSDHWDIVDGWAVLNGTLDDVYPQEIRILVSSDVLMRDFGSGPDNLLETVRAHHKEIVKQAARRIPDRLREGTIVLG